MFDQKKRKLRSSLLILGTGGGDVLGLDVSAGQLKWRVSDCHPGWVPIFYFLCVVFYKDLVLTRSSQRRLDRFRPAILYFLTIHVWFIIHLLLKRHSIASITLRNQERHILLYFLVLGVDQYFSRRLLSPIKCTQNVQGCHCDLISGKWIMRIHCWSWRDGMWTWIHDRELAGKV